MKRWYYFWSPTEGVLTHKDGFLKSGIPDLHRNRDEALFWKLSLLQGGRVRFPEDWALCSFEEGAPS